MTVNNFFKDRHDRRKQEPSAVSSNAVGFCRLSFSEIPPIRKILFSADCGFPSPAADYASEDLDLKDFFLPNPLASFAVTLKGDALSGIGLFDGDKLFIDRSISPKNGCLVLCYLDGSFLVRRFHVSDGEIRLSAEHPDFPDILAKEHETLSIEGVAVSCGRRFRSSFPAADAR